MDAREIISDVRQAGASIFIEGSNIVVKPLSAIDAELQVQIRDNRDRLFNILQADLEDLIEITKSKAWNEYSQSVATSEVERVILDSDRVQDCTPGKLDAWASALTIRLAQARKIVPTGWDKTSRCARCGPVWSDHGLDTLSCGWCWMSNQGKDFPTPNHKR